MKQIIAAASAGLALALAGAVAQSPAQQPAAPAACNPGNAARFVCGVRNPEDLVSVPGAPEWIIGSGMAVANQAGTGGLILIDRRTHTAVRLPAPSGKARAPFANCPNPPNVATFSAHGLNLRPAGRGKSTLYVVGHGSREAIEVFDVVNTRGAPSVTWAGCVMALAGAFMNSVAVLGDGRIVMTDFYHAPTTMADAQQGRNTGAIYLWKPGQAGFEKLPGTDLPGPNGIEVTPDGKYVFVADWGRSAVKRYELAAPNKEPWSMTLTFRADNLRWAPNGTLLLAGPGADPNCPAGQRCPQIPVVGALDPAKLTLTYLKRGPAEPSMGGVSSALVVGDELWTASYTGDRVGYQTLPK